MKALLSLTLALCAACGFSFRLANLKKFHIQQRGFTCRREMIMHMGHSHTHSHDHEDHDDDDFDDDHDHTHTHAPDVTSFPAGGPSTIWGRIVKIPQSAKARVTLITFFFLLPIIIRRRLTKLDLSVFSVLATSLFFFDSAKRSVKRGLTKIKKFQQSMLKHSLPLTRAYFFKNENAADRVTLLGVWINIILSIIKFTGGIAFNSAVLVGMTPNDL